MTELDVVIVGGGIGGLAAALRCQDSGARFLLLEAADRFGGIVRTETQAGFVMEAGPDSLLTQKPAGVGLVQALGRGERLVPANAGERRVFVLLSGRLHPMPDGLMLGVPTRIGPMVTTSLFSWPAKLRMAAEVAMRPRPETGDESIRSFLGRHFGREVVERIGEPLLAGIHAGDPDRLSMGSAFPRLVEMERQHGSLIRALWRTRPTTGEGSPFVSLAGGLQELVEAATARLPGEAVRTGWAVDRVESRAGRWAVESRRGTVEATRLLLALPPAAAARVLASADDELAALLAGIPSVSTAVVYLGYARGDVRHPLDGHGLLVPRTEGLGVSAVSFVSTKFPGRAPEGHVLLRAFLGGARDPDVLQRDDATLVSQVRAELGGVLGLRGTPTLARVFRWPNATPQMVVGHASRVAAIEERLARWPGLALTGAGLRTTGIPDTVADAAAQAETLLRGPLPPPPARRDSGDVPIGRGR